MKKIVFILFLLIMISVQIVDSVNAQNKIYNYPKLDCIGRVIGGGSIIIDNEENELYRVFENPDKALMNYRSQNRRFLNVIAEYGDLPAFDDKSFDNFVDTYYKMIGSKQLAPFADRDSGRNSLFELFADIYENTQWNNEIIRTLRLEIPENERIILLSNLLPYYDPLVRKQNEKARYSSVSGFNISNGVTYADAYYFFPNTQYHLYSQDCTNFASQILRFGGVAENDTGSQNSGWWYHHQSGTDECSNSWRMVNAFSSYFGMYYSTKSHSNFVTNIRKGSFIVCDKADDGNWDHVGFVTDKSTTYSSSLGYYDYKVAQHTSNYNSWASSSINDWDELEDGTCRMGVVIY